MVSGVENKALQERLEALRQEHRDLDAAIDALTAGSVVDQIQVTRLQEAQAAAQDLISRIEDDLLPDIIA